jgi:peroxiredoxin Q/BCP
MKSTLMPLPLRTFRTAALALVAFLVSLTPVSAQTASGTTQVLKGDAAAASKSADAAYASKSNGIIAAPKVGEAAPDFKLPYATAEKIFFREEERMTLSSLKGKNVVLAFYPADWSGGCTTEVCTFRDTFMEFGKLNAVVLGVSGDYVFSHHEWAKHHKLPFALLSDHDHSVARAYASYNDKYGLNNRTVYVIDKEGVVRYMNLAFKAGDKKDYDALRAELEKLK